VRSLLTRPLSNDRLEVACSVPPAPLPPPTTRANRRPRTKQTGGGLNAAKQAESDRYYGPR